MINPNKKLKKKPAPRPSPDKPRKGICEVCGASPTIEVTGMCGPCTHGTMDALGEGDTWPERT